MFTYCVMYTITTTKVIEIAYEIRGVYGYAFGKDKCLYNTRTNRKLKHTINGGRLGWWIGKKFYSHNVLKPLLVRPTKAHCPF